METLFLMLKHYELWVVPLDNVCRHVDLQKVVHKGQESPQTLKWLVYATKIYRYSQ